MKKIAIFLVALAPAMAPAQQIDTMSKKAVAAKDAENWYSGGNSLAYMDATWKYYHQFVDKLVGMSTLLKRCVTEGALDVPDKEQPLEALLEEFSGLLETSITLNKMGKGDSLQKGDKRALALLGMSKSINDISKKAPKLLVEGIIARRVVKHRYEWRMAAEVIVNFKMVSRFQKIDECYGNFINGIETIINRKRKYSMHGSMLMMMVGFNDFVQKDLRLRPELEADVRVLDRYLALMEKSKLNDFKESIKKVKEDSANALWMLNKEHDLYEERAIEIYPDDRKMFEDFFKNWVLFLNKVDECVKECEEMIADADNTSNDVGKLRHMTGFHPNRSFNLLGRSDNNAPEYRWIIRALLQDCKLKFLKNAERHRGEYSNDVPTAWD